MKIKWDKILVTTATSFEMVPLLNFLEAEGTKKSFFEYQYRGHSVFPLVTGVGPVFTSFAMARYLEKHPVDIVANIGIAGAYDKSLAIGATVHVTKDRFADIGITEADGSFKDVFELELMESNTYPFDNAWINNTIETDMIKHLPKVASLTVNTVTGTDARADQLYQTYKAEIESMEGAAFAYACKMMRKPYIQMRGISNYVEARNRESWDINKAINNVNKELINLLKRLDVVSDA